MELLVSKRNCVLYLGSKNFGSVHQQTKMQLTRYFSSREITPAPAVVIAPHQSICHGILFKALDPI
jgi:hypothetical protein